MPTTLVSFIGKGQRAGTTQDRPSYKETNYLFPGNDGAAGIARQTSLFGAALLRHLIDDRKMDVDRWLVLGTSESLWSEVYRILPDPDLLADQYFAIDEKVTAGKVTEQDLDGWQKALNAAALGVTIHLVLVGNALDKESQHSLCRAMFNIIPHGSDVVFDVTHGFRHQPIITSFVVGLMRRTHDLGRVSFYYGAYEARDQDRTPVIELPICQELLDVTERLAVFDTTGNYAHAAKIVGCDSAVQAWFAENTNRTQQAGQLLGNMKEDLARVAGKRDPVKSLLAKTLLEQIDWPEGHRSSILYRDKAEQALKWLEHARAAVFAFEAICRRAAEVCGKKREWQKPGTESATQWIVRALKQESDSRLFCVLRDMRNACAHAREANTREAKEALADRHEFQKIIQSSLNLFDRLGQAIDRKRNDTKADPGIDK